MKSWEQDSRTAISAAINSGSSLAPCLPPRLHCHPASRGFGHSFSRTDATMEKCTGGRWLWTFRSPLFGQLEETTDKKASLPYHSPPYFFPLTYSCLIYLLCMYLCQEKLEHRDLRNFIAESRIVLFVLQCFSMFLPRA
jgi:hypothetical protein